MKVKINTKEKFHVITPEEPILSANMTEDIKQTLLSYLDNSVKNIILNFENVHKIDENVASELVAIQDTFYNANCSMVVCNLSPEIESFLDEKQFLEFMNTTSTESEAWDIVQMEEIERDLF